MNERLFCLLSTSHDIRLWCSSRYPRWLFFRSCSGVASFSSSLSKTHRSHRSASTCFPLYLSELSSGCGLSLTLTPYPNDTRTLSTPCCLWCASFLFHMIVQQQQQQQHRRYFGYEALCVILPPPTPSCICFVCLGGLLLLSLLFFFSFLFFFFFFFVFFFFSFFFFFFFLFVLIVLGRSLCLSLFFPGTDRKIYLSYKHSPTSIER